MHLHTLDLRHIITVAHCLCENIQDGKAPRFLCLDKTENQIRPKQNEITIYGGSASVENFAFTGRWEADEARILDSDFVAGLRKDIGIAVLSGERNKDKPFFDKAILMAEEELRKAVVVPICLVSKNKNFKRLKLNKKRTFRGVGWGRQYDDSTTRGSPTNLLEALEDLRYSSCMTSPGSPEYSRYQHCDLKDIEKNNWKCNNSHDHPGFDKKCDVYMEQFERNKHSLQNKWSETQLKGIDIVYIIDGNGKQTTCYSPWLIKERGWCFIDGPVRDPSTCNSRSWGTCSLSCSDELKAVSM